eukprot:6945229-Alexandrium_andersonii.AAC.1
MTPALYANGVSPVSGAIPRLAKKRSWKLWSMPSNPADSKSWLAVIAARSSPPSPSRATAVAAGGGKWMRS